MRKLLMFCLGVVFCGSALAQNTKQQIASCVERELAKVRTEVPFAKEGGVTCYKAIIKNFKCVRDNKDLTVSYAAPDGHVITSATRVITSRSDRGAAGELSWDTRRASVEVSCRGNACDKGEREWSHVRISGVLQRIPTEAERKSVMDTCLDALLK